MQIEKVQKGDTIKTHGGKGIEVRKVTEFACSSRGTHVNDRFCWDRGSEVDVVREEHEAIDLEQVVQAI